MGQLLLLKTKKGLYFDYLLSEGEAFSQVPGPIFIPGINGLRLLLSKDGHSFLWASSFHGKTAFLTRNFFYDVCQQTRSLSLNYLVNRVVPALIAFMDHFGLLHAEKPGSPLTMSGEIVIADDHHIFSITADFNVTEIDEFYCSDTIFRVPLLVVPSEKLNPEYLVKVAESQAISNLGEIRLYSPSIHGYLLSDNFTLINCAGKQRNLQAEELLWH